MDSSARVTRQYRAGTLILETTFETADGAATLIDFMPPRDDTPNLVRLVLGRRGRIDFRTELVIRFDYGASVPWVRRLEDGGGLQAVAGPDMLVLRTPVPLHGEDLRTVGEFSVTAGDKAPFVLSYGPSYKARPSTPDSTAALAETETFWHDWAGRCPSVGPWTEAVKRSVLTLKALTYQPTGGIVAAPTTSLPERIGGPRNWDYRYCWLRDATFTLLAFMKLGYYHEARAWRDWLLRAIAGSPAQPQILYSITGEKHIPEWEVPWLAGYEASLPVRIGNAAATQLQFDVYGEVADALSEAERGGLPAPERTHNLRRLALGHLETIWREPDEGIWEVRGGRRHFTHSRVMVWVAFDRAARTAHALGDVTASERWRRIADDIHAEVCHRGFNPELGSFVQFYGSRQVDAALLHIPLVRFLPATTHACAARWRRSNGGSCVTVDWSCGMTRKRAWTGFPPGRARSSPAASGWPTIYVLQGRLAEARDLFEGLLGLQNDVGLLAEEYDPHTGRMLGNFPQAFSHVGLINTALYLTRAEGPAGERGIR